MVKLTKETNVFPSHFPFYRMGTGSGTRCRFFPIPISSGHNREVRVAGKAFLGGSSSQRSSRHGQPADVDCTIFSMHDADLLVTPLVASGQVFQIGTNMCNDLERQPAIPFMSSVRSFLAAGAYLQTGEVPKPTGRARKLLRSHRGDFLAHSSTHTPSSSIRDVLLVCRGRRF